jgi:hypothetical protein
MQLLTSLRIPAQNHPTLNMTVLNSEHEKSVH